jgi:GT2 family glycosyltransferase
MNPRVSTMVLSYNSKDYLEMCLKSLTNQSYRNHEIIMVDNNSTDGSVEFVARNFPQVRIIAFDKNYGYTGAYNRAVMEVDSEYVAFLNPDIEADPDWLEELMRAVQKSGKEVKIWGSKTLFYNDREMMQFDRGFISPNGSAVCPTGLMRDIREAKNPQFTGYVQGSTILLERDAFLQLGGFDPDYFLYQEDIDLCWRAWLWGYKVFHVPTAIVYHVSGLYHDSGTPLRLFSGGPFIAYYDTRNQKANIIKNFSLSRLPRAIIVGLAYDLLVAIQSLRANNRGVIRAVLRAYIHCFTNLGSLLKKRRFVQKKRVVSDRELERIGVFLPLRQCIGEYMRLRKLYGNRRVKP